MNFANHRLKDTSGKLLEVETSRNTHLKAEGNLEQVARSNMPIKGILLLRRKLSSDKISIKFSPRRLIRAKSRDNFPSLNVIQTGGENGRCPNAPPYDQRSAEWNEKQEECSRHEANKLHKEVYNTEGLYKDVHNTNFFRNCAPAQAKNTATGLVIHSKEREYKVDSGASSHMMVLSSLNSKDKKTIRRSIRILHIQTANGSVVSDTQTKVYMKELGGSCTVRAIVGKTMQ